MIYQNPRYASHRNVTFFIKSRFSVKISRIVAKSDVHVPGRLRALLWLAAEAGSRGRNESAGHSGAPRRPVSGGRLQESAKSSTRPDKHNARLRAGGEPVEPDTRGRNARCVDVQNGVVARPTTPSLTVLLSSFNSRSHNASSAGSPVFDDGREFSLVILNGTVQITYNHANYNIPIEVVIPDQYPDSPPIVYVRPTPTMEIKPNHSVIDSNGNVNRLPYLSRWTNSHMHNLASLCLELSARFSAEPPLFSRPPGSATRGSTGSFTQTAQAG
jgi:ubiquitin-protein ligase